MSLRRFYLGLGVVSQLMGCGGDSGGGDYGPEEEYGYNFLSGYGDGTYCAEIEYYYSRTGTSSTYTLEVKIEDNELIMIHWPNGGWLDDSHFMPPDISDGEATFTSDMGADYTVRITGSGGGCNTDSYVSDEEEVIRSREEEEQEQARQEEEEERIQEEEKAQEEEEQARKEEEENGEEY